VAAGEPPTISQQYENWTTQWVDALVDLGCYVPFSILNDVHPRHLQLFDGRLVTVPFNKSIIVLYYRQDLVPVPPKTWDEFLSMSCALTADLNGDGTVDRWGTGLRPPNPEIFLTFLAQNGGSILSEDWTKVTINDARGMETAQFAAALAKCALVQGGFLSGPFGLNQIAMFVDTSAGYPFNLDAAKRAGFEMGVAPVPCRDNCASMIQGTNVGIFAMNQSKEQIEAAAKYIAFLLQADNTVYWATRTGYLPVTVSGFDSPGWQTFIEANPHQKVMTEQFMIGGFGQLLHPKYWDMREAMITYYELLLRGEKTPDAVMSELAAELGAIIAD
jgi:multiple sugar transport system substrate-binding protein